MRIRGKLLTTGNEKEPFGPTRKFPTNKEHLSMKSSLTDPASQSEICRSILKNRFVAPLFISVRDQGKE